MTVGRIRSVFPEEPAGRGRRVACRPTACTDAKVNADGSIEDRKGPARVSAALRPYPAALGEKELDSKIVKKMLLRVALIICTRFHSPKRIKHNVDPFTVGRLLHGAYKIRLSKIHKDVCIGRPLSDVGGTYTAAHWLLRDARSIEGVLAELRVPWRREL